MRKKRKDDYSDPSEKRYEIFVKHFWKILLISFLVELAIFVISCLVTNGLGLMTVLIYPMWLIFLFGHRFLSTDRSESLLPYLLNPKKNKFMQNYGVCNNEK